MARNPELEAILLARYELENAEPSQKTERRARLDALLAATMAKASSKSLSAMALIEITADAYREFKRARKKAGRARRSRLH